MRRDVSVALALTLAAALAGCAARPVTATQCQTDAQCGDGLACVGGACLPRAAPPATWDVELSPRADSSAALTEILGPTAPAAAFDLAAVAKTTVQAALAADPTASTAAPLAAAHFVVTLPSTIPGRPDLQFETDLPTIADATAPTFSLDVPASIVGRAATFEVLPLAPSDAAVPPLRASLPVAASVVLEPVAKKLTVRGRLLSAVGDPRAGFTARAFVGADLVSSVAVTTTDGVFTLVVPVSDEVAAPTPGLTLDLEPADGAPDPRYASRAFSLSGNADLGDVMLPPFGQPNAFRFVVHGGVDDGPVVGDAIVRAWTLLEDDTMGRTDFVRAAPTDASGRADLGLLPGSTNALRNYDVAVVPPSGSTYGIRCISTFPLASGGTDDAPANLPPVVLPNRTILRGTILDAAGAPASGVMVVATRTAPDPTSPCDANVGAPPATATTDDAGGFTVSLDPGTYRFDYDPASGAPMPRLTEAAVVVPVPPTDGALLSRSVSLPAGALVEGTVRGSDGATLALAAVSFFEPGCQTVDACSGSHHVDPVLKAQTRTDANGHYRAVIPSVAAP